MLKLLWRFALLLLAAVVFAWLADRPGSVTIQWLGREIEMSVVVAVTIALGLLVATAFLWKTIHRIFRSPRAMREFWRFRKHRKAYDSLSKGIIAAGAGDALTASRHAAIAGNTLADEPLVNVLAAQAAQLKGDRDSVRRIFEVMAKSPDTELFGLRGLFTEARQSGDLVAALGFAERALSRNPRLPWASSAVLQVQMARKLWIPAAQTLELQGKSGLLKRDEANRKRAAMLTAAALAAEDQDRPQALEHALEAHTLDPALVPAALVAARSLIANDRSRKAARLLRATWQLSQHPDLAELMGRTIPGNGPDARFERVRDLVGNPDESAECAYALARAALAAKRYDVARQALANHISDRPQARLCALMAGVEEADGNKGRSREWLARAVHAPRDPMWVSDGVANTRWAPVSPVTGEIVVCEWKAPFDVLPASDAFMTSETEDLAAIAAASDLSAATLKVEEQPAPLKVSLQRPPDDPGIDGADAREEK